MNSPTVSFTGVLPRELVGVIEAIRRHLRDQPIDLQDPLRLVDSAPVEVVTYTRGSRCRSVVGNEYFGVVTSKKSKVFGFRLHATTTVDQMIDEWVLAPASIPDLQVLDDGLAVGCRNRILVGDKIYSGEAREEHLWRRRGILLLPLRRDSQAKQWPEGVQALLGRVRHNIETAFSTLTTVFNDTLNFRRLPSGNADSLAFLYSDFASRTDTTHR